MYPSIAPWTVIHEAGVMDAAFVPTKKALVFQKDGFICPIAEA
jgi:hypothetical protein